MKVCIKCNVKKFLNEFSNNKKAKDGKCSQCKECYKQYYQDNKKHIQERKKQHYQKNKEYYKEYNKEWRQTDNGKEYSKQYYQENKEYCLQYYQENKERFKKYRKNNKEHFKKYQKEYNQTDAGKKTRRKINAKRRELGYNELNKPFPGSVGHHYNMVDVIHIPKELHLANMGHNVRKSETMKIINEAVWVWFKKERGL